MSQLRLSICIATLNRGDFIGATLETILAQITDEVEIVILDGASMDNTEEVIRRCQERCPQLRYIRQNMNKGVDHDFAESIRLARGEYCWLFSDDDLMKAGAIRTVLDAIKDQYALIIANAEVRNVDLSKVLQSQRLALSEDRIYGPGENHRLLAEIGDYLTFIGCVIIKRVLWNARETAKYFDSFFIHVGVIFQSPLPENALVIAKPLISIRYGNAMWLDKYFEIWMFKWPQLIWSFEHYPEATKLQVCHREPWRRIKTLLLFRAKGSYTINTYLKWLEPRLDSFWSRATSKTIAYFSGRIANLLGLLYYSARGERLVLMDLRNSPFYLGRLFRKRSIVSKYQSSGSASPSISSQRPEAAHAPSPLPLRKNNSQA